MNLVDIPTTPIQRLSDNYNFNSFYMKREDLLPVSFGGNKVRKALLFFQDFKKENADCIVTYGASSSNHCRIIANIAAANKIPCYIISPTESSYPTANKRLVELFGALIIECSVADVKDTINNQVNKLKADGYRPYFIQGGGHGNIGTQAYVDVYKEVLGYEKSSGIHFDYIFHASGTGTTQAGLICGMHLHQDKRMIVGISNARKNPYGGKVVADSIKEYAKGKNIDPINMNEILFIDDYVLEGYGSYNEKVIRTIKEVLVNDGIPLDTTYTGKAYWGMKEYIKKNNIKNKKILFIHTGGTPLFFDKLEEL